MKDWRQPVLGGWAADLIRQSGRAREIAGALTPAELVLAPGEGKWSVAHCLEHLATTVAAYRPYLEATIARGEGSSPSSPPPYRPGRIARWLIRMIGPGGRPLRAPKMFRPAETASPRAPELFAEAQTGLLELLRRADAIDLNRWKLRSPATPLLRFRVGEALELIIRHNDRHLDQAERARAAIRGR